MEPAGQAGNCLSRDLLLLGSSQGHLLPGKKQRCRFYFLPPVSLCLRLAVPVSQPCGWQEREHVKQPSVGSPQAACARLGGELGSSHSIPMLRVLYFEFCAPLPILEQLSLLLTLTHRHRPQCWGNQGPERDTGGGSDDWDSLAHGMCTGAPVPATAISQQA